MRISGASSYLDDNAIMRVRIEPRLGSIEILAKTRLLHLAEIRIDKYCSSISSPELTVELGTLILGIKNLSSRPAKLQTNSSLRKLGARKITSLYSSFRFPGVHFILHRPCSAHCHDISIYIHTKQLYNKKMNVMQLHVEIDCIVSR
jgi:hypothetical protein